MESDLLKVAEVSDRYKCKIKFYGFKSLFLKFYGNKFDVGWYITLSLLYKVSYHKVSINKIYLRLIITFILNMCLISRKNFNKVY